MCNRDEVPVAVRRHPTRPERAFTLIELLVVISIIAVLTSITLPVINTVQLSARSTKCTSNLRQLGAACMAYAGEHNQRLPDNTKNPSGDTSGADVLWPQLIWSYVYPTAYVGYSGPAAPPLFVNTVFECPQAKFDKGIVNVRSYGMNYYLVDGSSAQAMATASSMAANNRPQRSFLISDNYNYSQTYLNSMATRHRKRCNMVFCDGHTEAVVVTAAMMADTRDPIWGNTSVQSNP